MNTATDRTNPMLGWLTDLLESTARTIARETAQLVSEKLKEALRDHGEDRQCNAGQAAQLLGYVKPDGSPNVPAFKMYRQRNPDFANLGRKIGRRWYWLRSDVAAWINAHPRGGNVSGA
jgi:hypothetical protein